MMNAAKGVCIATLLLLTVFALGVTLAYAEETTEAEKPTELPEYIIEVQSQTCPVLGKKVDKNISTIYDGKLIYFCCPGCPAEFKKDPAKYISRLEGLKEMKLPVVQYDKCPVMGGKVSLDNYVVHNGKVYFFCCPSCVKEFKKNPSKYTVDLPPYITDLKNQTCPVMGNPASDANVLPYDDKIVRFCCPGCPSMFKNDPEKHMGKLEGVEATKIPVVQQETCPVTGKKVSKDHYAVVGGKAYFFCCPGCPAKFKADPDKYLDKEKQEKTQEKDEQEHTD